MAKYRGVQVSLLAFLVYSICPPFTSFDSYYSVPAALSLIRHGNTEVDEFVASAPRGSYYALDCVPPGGPAIPYSEAQGCAGGHWHNFFPAGVSVFALPPIFVIKLITGLLVAAFPKLSMVVAQPAIASLLGGDLVGGHALVELVCGATIGAVSAGLFYRMLLLFVPSREALLLSLLFAFGTAEWATASRNLMQHGPTVLCLVTTLYLLALARSKPHLVAYASIPLAIAFTVRPSNFISAAMITLFVAVHYRAFLLRFLACAMPIAALFFVYNLVALHSLLPRYYHPDAPGVYPMLPGFFINLISPSRGLLVFTPVFLFSIAGMVLAIRTRWWWPLSPYLIAIAGLHAILISRYWGGHSYGPRYFADMAPLLVLFLIPSLQRWREFAVTPRRAWAAVFLTLALWGVFVQARGATSVAANEWNLYPVNVDRARGRVWDWSDPQFLRGLR